MSVANKFKLAPWVFGGNSPVTLKAMSNVSMNPGCKEAAAHGAGVVSPSFRAISAVESMMTGSTTDVGTALASFFGANGGWCPVNSGATYTSLTAYGTEMANMGINGGSGVHFKNVLNNALVTMRSISAAQSGDATASLAVDPIWDGTNLPFAYATNVSLPTAPVVSELFTLGPASPNGTLAPGLINFELDLGLKVKREMSDGDLYPTHVCVEDYTPKITLTFIDASYIATIGLLGTAQGATASTFFLQARVKGGTIADPTATSHIKITMNSSQGMFWAMDGSFKSTSGEAKIVGYPIVGSSAILTFATGQAMA